MRQDRAMSWCRFSPTQVSPTGCGYGQPRTTCESPPPPWSAPKIWPHPALKQRSNDPRGSWGQCGPCGAGALARQKPEVPQVATYPCATDVDVDFAFQYGLWLS